MTPTKTVPVEPTEEMGIAVARYLAKVGVYLGAEEMLATYKAMLAAAPQQTSVGDELAAEQRRLDFIIDKGAFILESTNPDTGKVLYQLCRQDEDEYFWLMSGNGFFSTPREAIDYAINHPDAETELQP
jgi:hypothetical protein